MAEARNVLGVGAHFDDLELGCGGALAKHTANGDNVTMIVVTDSEYRSPEGEVIRSADKALEEGRQAASILGAEMLCLGYKTFEVPFEERLTKVLYALITARKIDTLYSHWVYDLHRDHQYAGRASLMAGRHVPRHLMFRSNYYDTEQNFKGNFYSDVTNVYDKKIASVKCYRTELERVCYEWIAFFKHQNRSHGMQIGCTYAEAFEIVRYLV